MAYRAPNKIAKSAKKLQGIEILTISVDLVGFVKCLKCNDFCIFGRFLNDRLCFMTIV